ncbi:MAG: hypothetical protein KAR42_05000 [candidate division Zixibacteria bacterium]|nr:hypothetical protein [candidate division Zixibacteria bacterium]
MLRVFLVIAGVLLLFNMTIAAGETLESDGPVLTGGFEFGYYGGPGFQAYGMVSNLSAEFPMTLRLALGYTSVEPGLSAEARQVFINDATNGIPEKKGRQIDFRLDMLYPVKIFNLQRAYVFGGPRHARFVSNFKYIGGNEDFDVKSNQWGIGGGLESFFKISPKFDLVLHLGIDYYFKSSLTGHDTMYSPDGDDSNGRDGYTYDDADNAIDQPKIEPRLMLGFAYNF